MHGYKLSAMRGDIDHLENLTFRRAPRFVRRSTQLFFVRFFFSPLKIIVRNRTNDLINAKKETTRRSTAQCG